MDEAHSPSLECLRITCLRFPFICLLLLCALPGAGVSAAELNITRNQLPVALGPYLDHFEDAAGDLGIEDNLTSDIDWRRSRQTVPTLGLSDSAHWFFVELRGRDMGSGELALAHHAPPSTVSTSTSFRMGNSSGRAGPVTQFHSMT